MGYFTRESIRFLAELERHNERPWFESNRARYEMHIKEPSVRLAERVSAVLGMEPHMLRIYRDVRFSKDKSPYKPEIGIGFRRGAGLPGLFLYVSPTESAIYGGMWRPEPLQLDAIRKAILAEPAAWKRAKKIGLDDDEEMLKRPPRGIEPTHPLADDLRRKSFTAKVALKLSEVTAPDLDRRILAAAKKLAPLNAFLSGAVEENSRA